MHIHTHRDTRRAIDQMEMLDRTFTEKTFTSKSYDKCAFF